MKTTLRLSLLAAVALLSPCAFGQNATDSNEGSRLEIDETNGIYRFKWYAKTGRTYFIQHTEDLVSWNWVPVIESGDDSIKEWGFTTTGTKFFARLWYDIGPSTDPANEDYDDDGVSNLYEIQHGSHPFKFEDSDEDGLPDGWLNFHGGQFAIYPPSRITGKISRNQTAPGNIFLFNDTNTPVSYTATVSANTGPSYGIIDSLTGGAQYVWEDISGNGTVLASISNSDDSTQAVSISGFQFPFFGGNYSQVFVSSNGYIALGANFSTYSNSTLPSTALDGGIIAPFWDDLHPGTAGTIYAKEEAQRLIIQFDGVALYGGGGNQTFQVVLNANGEIEFYYKTIEGNANNCTVGIADLHQTYGLTATANAAYLTGNMAVKFPLSATFFSLSPLSGTVPAFSSATINGVFKSLYLPLGTYSANVQITHDGPGSQRNLTAELTVKDEPAEVKIVNPTPQSKVLLGETIELVATATDADTQIAKVEFFDNGSKIGEDSSTPYRLSWTATLVGPRTFTAVSTDIYGMTTTSSAVTLPVLADIDADGMEDSWETANSLNTSRYDSMEDADGDRIPNIFEYRKGTPANDETLFPEAEIVVDQANGASIGDDLIFSTIGEALSQAAEVVQNSVTGLDDMPYAWSVIEVKKGIYEENLSISEVPVLLLAELGSDKGPVEIAGFAGNTVSISTVSALDGFIISHNDGKAGTGVYLTASGSRDRGRLLTNCIIRGNANTSGGGIMNDGSSVLRLAHCTITDNSANATGRAINNAYGATTILANCIVWGNRGSAENEIYSASGSGSIIGGSTSIIAGGEWGGINENPLLNKAGFITAASHNIVQRTATLQTPASEFDIHGVSRTLHGPPDIGSEEWLDSDSDGLPNWVEAMGITDPAGHADSDTLSNLDEFLNGSDPLKADTDGDGLDDAEEATEGTNPHRSDSDEDGLPDEWEVTNDLNPLEASEAADPDNDGFSNLEEYQLGKNPNLAEDTDGDSVPDGKERYLIYRTPQGGWGYFNINNPDTDSNGTLDGFEDYDKDGLSVLQELALGTNPNLSDTDGDGVSDGTEVSLSTNPLVPDAWANRDSDFDGLDDLTEITIGTSPFNPDTNGNGMPDGQELDNGGDPANPGPPPAVLPPPSPNPEPPADPSPTPPPPITSGQFDILIESKSISFPKYGHSTFQVLDPPKRFLSMNATQRYAGSTGQVESGPLGINGSATWTIDPLTGNTTMTGDGHVSSFGNPASPRRRSGTTQQYGYDDPPNNEADGTATINGVTTLTTENTTAMMVTNGKSKLEAFGNELLPGTPFAYRNVHENELHFDYQKVQFKFQWKDGVTEEQKYPVTYLVLFKPEDDPNTENVDESIENAEIIETITWNGQASPSAVFTIDPDNKKSGVDGSYSLLAIQIVPDEEMVGVVGDMVPSNKGPSGEKHFVTPKKTPQINNDHVTFKVLGVTSADFQRLFEWGPTGEAVQGEASKRKVGRDVSGKTTIAIKLKNSTQEVAKLNVWIVWAQINATAQPFNVIYLPDRTSISVGYSFNHVIYPESILSDAERPDFSDAPTPPPNVSAEDVGVQNQNSDLAGGAVHKWDTSRRWRMKLINPGNINFGNLHSTEFYGTRPNYPSNPVVGNDDKSTIEEDNDPYALPNKGFLTSLDIPELAPFSAEGNLGDEFEQKDQWSEFVRLFIGEKWYNVSDFFEWRIHFKFRKALEIDPNGDGDESDAQDFNEDGEIENEVWLNNGTTYATDNNDF